MRILEAPIRTPLKVDKDGNVYLDNIKSWADWFRQTQILVNRADDFSILSMLNNSNTVKTSQASDDPSTINLFPEIAQTDQARQAEDVANLALMSRAGLVPVGRKITTTAPLTGTGDLNDDLTIAIPQADTNTDGYLSQTDWDTFNGKEGALTKGNLTATSPLSLDQTRQVIGGAAVVSLVSGYGIRKTLTANTTFYVRTDGNNSNDGSANDADHAWLTLQNAANVIATLDCRSYNVTIQVGAGTYAPVSFYYFLGTGAIYLTGDSATPSNVIISGTTNCIRAQGATVVIVIDGFKLTNTTGFNAGIYALYNCYVRYKNIDFGSCTGMQVYSQNGALVYQVGNYSISGNAWAHIVGEMNGYIQMSGYTVTLVGAIAFSGYFAVANYAFLYTRSTTFVGAATGVRYISYQTGLIDTNGGGANYFPGDVAGSTATQGQYI